VSWWLSRFGILAGGLSLFSLVHKHWQFQLAPFVADLLAFYRAIFHTLVEPLVWLFSWLPFAIPHDFFVIYALFGAALARKLRIDPPEENQSFAIARSAVILLMWPYWLYKVILRTILLALYNDFNRTSPQDWGSWDYIKAVGDWLRHIAYAVGAFFAFFALNAGMN
jgi:hypothetical protein